MVRTIDGKINIRRHPNAIAARRQSRGLAVVKTHIKKTQQQTPRWRAGTLQIQTVSSDYVVGAPPIPQLPVRTASPPVMWHRSPSPPPRGRGGLTCQVGGQMVPMAGHATPPIPDRPPANWFDHYGEDLFIVQVFGCKVMFKEQRRDGKVTQEDWVVRIPRNHGHRLLRVASIYYSCSKYGWETALGWALRHKPRKVDGKGKLDTENVASLTRRYVPQDDWWKVGL